MALVVCPDCGREISDAAPICIHCGRPRPEPEAAPPPVKKPLPWDLVLSWLGGLCLAAGIGLLLAGRPGIGAAFAAAGLLAVFLGGAYALVTRFKR